MPTTARRAAWLALVTIFAALGVTGQQASALAAASPPGRSLTATVDVAHPGVPINQALVGVNHPVAGAGPAMRAIGARWARVDTYFDGMTNGNPDSDCSTGHWNPTALDQRVALARDEGAAPLVIADYTPACLASAVPPGTNPSFSSPDLGAHQATWDHFVFQMAYHEISAEGVRAFEIWNEPDGTFWTGTLAEYLTLYRDTASVLEQAASAAHQPIEVGGPALVFSDSSWIEPFLAFVSAEHLPLDFLSWHYYANYPGIGPTGAIPAPSSSFPPAWYNPLLRAQTFGEEVTQVRAELAKYPSLHPALWIDEWNADAGYDARQDGPFDAALVAAVLDSLQGVGLDRMNFFFVADDASDPPGNWGLLHPDLSPKPVYEAFRLWHEMATRQLPVVLWPDQSAFDAVGRIGAVAATSSDGTVTVLAYDFVPYDPTGAYGTTDPTPYDHVVTVALHGLRHQRYTWARSVVDATHMGTTTSEAALLGPTAEVPLALAGEGVTLLTLTPSTASPAGQSTTTAGTGPVPIAATTTGRSGELPATGADQTTFLGYGLFALALAVGAGRALRSTRRSTGS